MIKHDAQTFRWCFIGTGSLANTVAGQIVKTGRHRIVSIFSRRPESSRKFAEKFGGRAYPTAAEAIAAEDVDGVYVVTPHDSHYAYTKLALELGKPVLCEKAFTTDANQAEALIRLARSKKLYLAEAMWTWFAPTANAVKKWLDAGEYGQIKELKISYNMNIYRFSPRLTDPHRAGGALLDIGVYPITYLYRLFGNPVSIVCTGEVDGGVDLCERVTLTFADGSTHTASISMKDIRGFEHLMINGTRAKTFIFMFHCANRAKLKRKGGKTEVVKGDGSYVNEFDIVASEIREGLLESRCVPHQATLDVMKIMDECRRQMGLVYPFENP